MVQQGARSGRESAPVEEPLRATLRILCTLNREHAVTADDMRTVLSSGVSREQIEEALAVFFGFNITARLANAFGICGSKPRRLRWGAKYLLPRGYR